MKVSFKGPLLKSIKEGNVNLELGESHPSLINWGWAFFSFKLIRKIGNKIGSHKGRSKNGLKA